MTIGDPTEDIAQMGLGIAFVERCRLHEGIHGGSTLAAGVGTSSWGPVVAVQAVLRGKV